MWLERLGVQATEEEASRILMAVKAHSLRTKRLLSEEEFREIVEEILGPERVPAR
jgi:isopropylmalate/homocitrate/citramalate synthase